MSQSLQFGSGARQWGFTLLEMMVVLGIIAILAVLAMPTQTVNSLKNNREQVVEAYAHMEQLKVPVRRFFDAYGECPDNSLNNSAEADTEDTTEYDESETGISGELDAFGIAAAGAYSGHFVNSVVVGGAGSDDGGCKITARFKSTSVNVLLKDKQLALRLFGLETGVPKWACYSNVEQVAHTMMPRVCRFADVEAAELAQAPESTKDE